MNYIKHLNAVFQQFSKDSRLNPSHISIYMALFQYWNINRFPEIYFINRENIMAMAKVGSTVTYHKCLKQLDGWNYIKYLPSHNPFKGSKIKMLKFCTSTKTTTEISTEQELTPFININKLKENNFKTKLPKNIKEVIEFFNKRNWSINEAEKFFNHYTSIGWKVGGKIRIVDWKASAENWMLKAAEIKKENIKKGFSLNLDNLKTSNKKDYGQPL